MVKYIPKSVTIFESQEKWIVKNSINLSRYLQKKIEEDMKNGS